MKLIQIIGYVSVLMAIELLFTACATNPNKAKEIETKMDNSSKISGDTALRLARFFGTSAEYWMNLQRAWDLARARETIDVSDITPLAAA